MFVKKILAILILSIFISIPHICFGFDIKILGINSLKKIEWGKFILGTLCSVGVHELGHFVALESFGADYHFKINGFDYSTSSLSNNEIVWISRAGFIAQNGFGLILTSLNKKSSFIKGYNTTSFLEVITYPIRSPNSGDLYEIEKHGGKPTLEYAIFSSIALLNILRIEW